MMVREDNRFLHREGEARYDVHCPYYEHLFDDLTHNSPFHDHYCTLQFHVDVAGSGYAFCDQENHNNCSVFLNEMAKGQKELANLEGAD